MGTATGRLVAMTQHVQARRVEVGACVLVQVFEGAVNVTLTSDALAALSQLLRDDGVGFCTHCRAGVVLASHADRRLVSQQWQWACPTCGGALDDFPF